jgi:hypothetical protein
VIALSVLAAWLVIGFLVGAGFGRLIAAGRGDL